MPRGKVPGEWYAPTQPYPTKPAAYDMQGIRESDVNDWTPEIKAEALRVLNLHKYSDNVFEPPIERGQDGKFGMIMMPGNNGGSNWEGGAFDPETGIAYIFSSTQFNRRSLVNDPARSNMNYIDGGGGGEGGGGGGVSRRSRHRLGPLRRCASAERLRIASDQAAIRPGDGDQHEHGRPRLDAADRRHAGEHQESREAQRRDDSEDRAARTDGIMVTKTLLWAGERGRSTP